MTNRLKIRAVIPTWSLRGKEAAFAGHVNNVRRVIADIPNIDGSLSGVLLVADNPAKEERQIIYDAVHSAQAQQTMGGQFKISVCFPEHGSGLGFKKFKGLEIGLKDADFAVIINDNAGHPAENIRSMADTCLADNLEMVIGARTIETMLQKLPPEQLFFEARANQLAESSSDFGDIFKGGYADFVFGMLGMSKEGWKNLYSQIRKWETASGLSFWKATEEIGFGFDVFAPILGNAAGLRIGTALVVSPDLKELKTTSAGLEGRKKQFKSHLSAIETAKRLIAYPTADR